MKKRSIALIVGLLTTVMLCSSTAAGETTTNNDTDTRLLFINETLYPDSIVIQAPVTPHYEWLDLAYG